MIDAKDKLLTALIKQNFFSRRRNPRGITTKMQHYKGHLDQLRQAFCCSRKPWEILEEFLHHKLSPYTPALSSGGSINRSRTFGRRRLGERPFGRRMFRRWHVSGQQSNFCFMNELFSPLQLIFEETSF